jgi:hypothetical protein
MLADIIIDIAAQEQDKETKYYPRPSNAGPERCIRQMTYEAIGAAPKPRPGRSILTLDDSKFHELLTADWLAKTAYRLHSEQMEIELENAFPWLQGTNWKCKIKGCGKIIQSENCHGHIDGIITDLLGIDRLYEHKAINHFTFNRIWAGAWPLDYIAQCAIYIKGARAINPAINECLLLIKNKNTSQYIELLMCYDPLADNITILKVLRSDKQEYEPNFIIRKVIETAIKKFQQVEEYRKQYNKDGTLPPRPFIDPEEYPCSYCRFKEICWQGFEEEFQNFQETVPLNGTHTKLAAQYQELTKAENQIKKQKEEIKEEIKTEFHASRIKSAIAGSYLISLNLQKRQTIEEELIPPQILQTAKVEKITEVLRISVIGAKKTASLPAIPQSRTDSPASSTSSVDKSADKPALATVSTSSARAGQRPWTGGGRV